MDGFVDFLGTLGILGVLGNLGILGILGNLGKLDNLERKSCFPYYFTCFKSYSVIRFTSSSKLV